jgi:hypothetical protein
VVSITNADPPYSEYTLSKVQLSGAYRITGNVWLNLGGFASVVHEDTGAESGALVSVWWKF